MALVENILDDLDTAVLGVGEKYFTSTATALDPMLTIVTTLLIAMIGIGMALGAYSMSTRDAWQLVSRIVLVFLFARSWTNFGMFYDALSSASGNLALSFFDSGAGSPAVVMDQFAAQMSDVTDGAARSVSSIMRGVVGALLFMILALLMAAYVLIVGFSKIMLAFLLGVAPLAMIATIFDRTKNLFESWLTAFVGYLLYPVAAAAVIGAIVSMADAQFAPQARVENLSMLLGFLCIAFVGIAALLSIPTAASHITGTFHLANFTPQALRTVGRPLTTPAGAASRAVATRSAAFASGVTTGHSPAVAARASQRAWAEKGAEFRAKMNAINIMRGKQKP